VPELFSPQPAEVALPSDDLSRALIAFWRHRDADSGAVWSFAEEHFEGELMGDLYQELDPVVKDRFALCQTPDFVRAFILESFYVADARSLGDDVSLLASGVLDSTGVLEVVSFIEERFGVKVQDEELVPENLDSIGSIARFIERRRESSASRPDVTTLSVE
jgi:acyl carrier protein